MRIETTMTENDNNPNDENGIHEVHIRASMAQDGSMVIGPLRDKVDAPPKSIEFVFESTAPGERFVRMKVEFPRFCAALAKMNGMCGQDEAVAWVTIFVNQMNRALAHIYIQEEVERQMDDAAPPSMEEDES